MVDSHHLSTLAGPTGCNGSRLNTGSAASDAQMPPILRSGSACLFLPRH
jgi:hypothetical protein